jgi:outer membrane protein assembly factor BamB
MLAHLCVALLLGLAAPIFGEPEAAALSWPQWGGPTRDFRLSARDLATSWPPEGPRELWRRPLGDGYAGIVAAGGVLYTMFRGDGVDVATAIDATTGRTIWEQPTASPVPDFMFPSYGPGPHSTPLLAGGRLFTVGYAGRLCSRTTLTGEEIWCRELWDELDGTRLERGYGASPLAVGSNVVVPVGGSGGALVALDQASGAIVWRSAAETVAYASPMRARIGDIDQLVLLGETALLGFDPATGSSLFQQQFAPQRTVHVTSPVVGDGWLFYNSSNEGRGLRTDRSPGSNPDWVTERLRLQVGNVVRIDDTLYGSNPLAAVEARSGTLLWRTREIGRANLLAVGDTLLALEEDGELVLARPDARGLTVLARAEILNGRAWTAPTLIGTRLYLRDRAEIVALHLGPAR